MKLKIYQGGRFKWKWTLEVKEGTGHYVDSSSHIHTPFSILSMFVVKVIYDGQFQRYDKPEVSGYLQYSNVDGYDRTTVEFESKENTLTGYLYGEGNEKGVVVIAHGLGEGAENYLAETMYFVDNGWRVFSFDGTGSHESEEKAPSVFRNP